LDALICIEPLSPAVKSGITTQTEPGAADTTEEIEGPTGTGGMVEVETVVEVLVDVCVQRVTVVVVTVVETIVELVIVANVDVKTRRSSSSGRSSGCCRLGLS
jgi:hypothetical protein